MIENTTKCCNVLQPPLFHVSAITSHTSGLHLIKGDAAECFHSRARAHPSD